MAPPQRSSPDLRTLVTHPELKSQQTFPVFKTLGEPEKSRLERMLAIFADVRAGEGQGALLLALNVFLLLAAYYLLRNVRQVLILTEGGAPFGWTRSQVAAYASGAMAIVLLGVVPLYGWLASRVPRMRLITITTVFFAANLVLFSLLGQSGVRVGIAFYIWLGVFNVFIIAQFWGLANDLYTEGQGRRLFPMIGVGASFGGLFGALAVGQLVSQLAFTPLTVMLVSAAVLLVALAITMVANRRVTKQSDPDAAGLDDVPLGRAGGFQLLLSDRYLTWIGVLIILLNIVNSTGGYMVNYFAEQAVSAREAGEGQEFVAVFFSRFDALVSLTGLVLQLFITSRALRHFGVRGSLFVLPVLALVNYSVIAVAPILAVVVVGKILENGTDYSLQNTLRHALFLPTSREAKYKAKAAVDTFCTRLGDVLYALLVAFGAAVGLTVSGYAWLNVALTVAWLAVAGQIAREHRRRTI